MSKLSGAVSRVGACVQGLFTTSIAMVFVVAGGWIVYSTAHQAATWGTCTATVTKVTGGDAEADEVKVAYRYTVAGREYGGELRAEEDDRKKSASLKQYKVGQALSIRYDPADPAKSQLSVEPEGAGFAFIIFVLPFLAIGVNTLWFGLSGREIVASSQPNAQSSSVPGGGLFWVFVPICAAGAVAQLALATCLAWPVGLFTGLAILFVFVPGATWFAVTRIRSWRRRRETATPRQHGRNTHEAVPDRPQEEEVGHEPEEFAATDAGLAKKLAIAAGVTLFWCGITGVFVGVIAYSCGMSIYAQQHFLPAEGVILSSKVVSSSDSDGTTYRPALKYRYRVGGKDYVSDRYTYGTMGTSESGYANAVVRANPKGAAVTVYYDPGKPSESVLSADVPGIIYFLMLFLQPFVLVGLAMIAWTMTLPWTHRRLVEFLARGPSLPWRIPSWGTAREDAEGILIRKSHRLAAAIGHFFLGYGLACFAGIFVVGFLFGGFSNPRPEIIGRAFVVAAGVGLLAMGRKLFVVGGARVLIDPINRRLCVRSRLRDEQVSFDEIKSWRLRQIHYPSGVRVNDQTVRYLLLEVLASDGRTVPVHAFKPQAGDERQATAIARKAQQCLAALTAGEVQKPIASDDTAAAPAPADPSNPVEAVSAVAGAVRGWRSGPKYSDLT
jgi:hypothetical protein